MRLGLISIGFLMLHLDFLPTSISLTIIILGLIYVYQDSQNKESLYLILTNVLLIVLSFLNTPLLFIVFKYIYIVALLFFIEKNIFDEKDKSKFHKSIITYTSIQFTGLIFIPVLGFTHLLALFTSIYIYIQLSRLRKKTIIDKRPQVSRTSIPSGVSIFVIVISIAIIVMTRQDFVEYTYDKANTIEIYEVISDNEDIKIYNIAEQTILYKFVSLYSGGYIPILWMNDNISGKTLSLEVNGNRISEADIEFDGTNWFYKQAFISFGTVLKTGPQKCKIIIDDKEYDGIIQKSQSQEYGYKDNHIQIDHCYIQEGYVASIPRIQVKGKGRYIRSVTILDKDNNQLVDYVYETSEYSSSDNIIIYLEKLSSTENRGSGPYKIKIGFEYQDNHIVVVEFEEYQLVRQ